MYKLFYKLFLSKLDAENAHSLGIFMMKNLPFLLQNKNKSRLGGEIFGHKIANKIGIAAGFDKNGDVISTLFGVGFGFVEIGTVTPKPQIGNPKPRIFRIGSEHGIINRLGFPNKGAEYVLERLKSFLEHKKEGQIVGVNIGRNKDGGEEDYLLLIEKFIQYADYITINISSPNTPGLRNLLEEKPLSEFLAKISKKRSEIATKKPFLLKISPDLPKENLTFIYALLVKNGIEGIIISNTTISRPNLKLKNINQEGGMSGKFLKEKSLELLKEFHKINDAGIFVISAGGIETKEDVRIRLQNGANLVQIYTSLALNGTAILSDLTNDN